jgi:2-polyprenyl-6-hydroxyphenyl methylase/3-demethylubiquinone-9 3-methyltransferase
VPCKICGLSAPFFDIVDFNKCVGFYCFGPAEIAVPWHRCDECGFLFTCFFDDWTHDDFRRFIYNDDYALVDPGYDSVRPISVADHLAQFLGDFKDARILDYGAGGGLFANRLMELGFKRVESYDPFSLPVQPSGPFDLITCEEVIEHVPSPLAALQQIRSLLTHDGCVIIGESLQPPDITVLRGNWWYVAPRNGHVSTFADRSFAALAERLGLVFHRGGGHHVLRMPGEGPSAELAEKFGAAFACFRLRAPASGAAAGFHGLEQVSTRGLDQTTGRSFRWSASDTVTWEINVPAGPQRLVQVVVPFVHEARHGFASACRVDIGESSAPVAIRDSAICAEVDAVPPGRILVTLRTPELLNPPRDGRSLGLAIQAGPPE